MSTSPDHLDVTGLCALLGVSRTTLHRHRRAWERTGFPTALPWAGRRKLWRRAAVERWIATQARLCGCDGWPVPAALTDSAPSARFADRSAA